MLVCCHPTNLRVKVLFFFKIRKKKLFCKHYFLSNFYQKNITTPNVFMLRTNGKKEPTGPLFSLFFSATLTLEGGMGMCCLQDLLFQAKFKLPRPTFSTLFQLQRHHFNFMKISCILRQIFAANFD